MRNYDGYQIVHESLIVSESETIKTAASLVGASVGAEGPWQIYRIIRSAFDAGTRRCGVFALNTMRRRACMMKVKIDAYEKGLVMAKKQNNKSEISKLSSKIQILKSNMKKTLDKMESQDKGEMKPKYKGTGIRIFDIGT